MSIYLLQCVIVLKNEDLARLNLKNKDQQAYIGKKIEKNSMFKFGILVYDWSHCLFVCILSLGYVIFFSLSQLMQQRNSIHFKF